MSTVFRLMNTFDRGLVKLAHVAGLGIPIASVRYVTGAVLMALLFLPGIALVYPALRAFVGGGYQPLADGLSEPIVAAISLSFALLIIVSINRAWSENEDQRLKLIGQIPGARVKSADELPDLRDEGLVSALLLIPLFPLWLSAINAAICGFEGASSCPFTASSTAPFAPWLVLSAENLFRGALFFDFPEVYDWSRQSGIDARNGVGEHLIMIMRILIDFVLISGFLQLIKINRAGRNAVDALINSPTPAGLAGRRVIGRMLKALREADDPAVLKNAALALGQIGDPRSVSALVDLTRDRRRLVAGRAVDAIGEIMAVQTLPATSRLQGAWQLAETRLRELAEDLDGGMPAQKARKILESGLFVARNEAAAVQAP
ncbi:HEAT repeat domain-containing protein [Pyruvatibacter sp.]